MTTTYTKEPPESLALFETIECGKCVYDESTGSCNAGTYVSGVCTAAQKKALELNAPKYTYHTFDATSGTFTSKPPSTPASTPALTDVFKTAPGLRSDITSKEACLAAPGNLGVHAEQGGIHYCPGVCTGEYMQLLNGWDAKDTDMYRYAACQVPDLTFPKVAGSGTCKPRQEFIDAAPAGQKEFWTAQAPKICTLFDDSQDLCNTGGLLSPPLDPATGLPVTTVNPTEYVTYCEFYPK